MASSGIKLHPVASSDIKWHQLASSDIKWDQVGSGGIKWQVTYYLLLANWYLHLDTCYPILATLNYFTFHSKYFTWITLPTLLFLNYFTLFTSVDVLCFSNLQSFEFSKSNNGLASLSLAQLSPSLFLHIPVKYLKKDNIVSEQQKLRNNKKFQPQKAKNKKAQMLKN